MKILLKLLLLVIDQKKENFQKVSPISEIPTQQKETGSGWIRPE